MKKVYLVIALFSFSFAQAQDQNALHFDGTNDLVVVNGASSLLNSSTNGFSMTCWASLANSSPSYPNFDGICGFRNESTADFYILQLSATSIEARFRNSSGSFYTLTINNVVNLNSWKHYALVYDGSSLKFYADGVLKSSTPATGSIGTGASFEMGKLSFQTTNFQFSGKLDEVSLWSTALDSADIACIFNNSIDPSSSDLELYYDFNVGTSGGSNSGLTSLPNIAGTSYNGSLSGFALSGTTSNWVAGTTQFTTDSISMCPGDSVVVGGSVIHSPGFYNVYHSSSNGCDSLVITEVTEKDTIDTVMYVTLSIPPILGVTPNYDAYQWVDCNNQYSHISGETADQFSPSTNGSYACIITYNGCVDTTHCQLVEGIGISEENGLQIRLYPNPNSGRMFVDGIPDESSFKIIDMQGRTLMQSNYNDTGIDLRSLSPGNYILEFLSVAIKERFIYRP